MLSPKAKQNATAVAASPEEGNFTWEMIMSETFISTLQIGVVEFLSVFNIFSSKNITIYFQENNIVIL